MKPEGIPFAKIAVLMGGFSGEREVSLRSGQAVYEALRAAGLDARAVDLKTRDFRLELAQADFDFAFIALHGQGGEDGVIQKILEDKGIAFLGGDSRASRTAFDKVAAKKIFKEENILAPEHILLRRDDWKERAAGVHFPVFLKPPCEGSSLGVRLALTAAELAAHAEELFKVYPELLCEERIIGREITVPILENRALPVVEIKPSRVFYDHIAKYTKGMTDYYAPADFPAEITRNIQQTAVRAHASLGLRDFSRVDMFFSPAQQGRIYVLEINTIPGFTETSLFPKSAAAAGMSFQDLCLELLRTAARRVNREKNIQKEPTACS